MLDTATCNASDSTGCTPSPTPVTVGSSPALLAIDQANNTVYVPDSQADTMSVINAATCNATEPAGCGHVSTVTVGSGAQAVALNRRTHTAYVANFNDGTVSVVDTASCNATVRSGCDQTPPTVAVGPSPAALVVDQASDTVFVQTGPTTGASLSLVAMINGADCNAADPSGCGQTPRTTPAGSGPQWIAENPATRTVYVSNEEDSSVSVIDAATCNATNGTGCREVAPALSTGFNTGAVAVDPSTDTVYAASQSENTVSVLNGATCNATTTWGCTQFAPTTTVRFAPQGVATDPTTHTVYVTNRNDNIGPGTVSVINDAVCNASRLAGCDRPWPTFTVGNWAQDLRVDQATDTVYVVNANDNTVSVMNGATCNAQNSSACQASPATITVGNGPYALAIDQATDTIYVANGNDNTVSVINGATCNGTHPAGCNQTPPTIPVGSNPDGIAIDEATDTIYVANGNDNTVSIINGTTCNGTHPAGCNQTPPAIPVGDGPYPIAVDQRTNTVYVANGGDGTLSMINAATCNANTMTGCGRTPSAVNVGGLPFGLALDESTDTLYITSIVDSDVQTIDAGTCNATTRRNCDLVPDGARVGGWGGAIALDPSADSAYVPDNVDGTVSLLALIP